MSKPHLQKEYLGIMTKQELSRYDTVQLLTYGISLYICGMIGDKYNQRTILTIAYLILGISFIMLGVPGLLKFTYQWYFYLNMIVIGASNALIWPCFISIMGNWFPK